MKCFNQKPLLGLSLAGAALSAALLLAPNKASAVIIDFENTPSLPTGPNLFANAGPAQNITTNGVTFSGGTILGLPTNFPASPFGTPPNVYGTASSFGGVVADPSLQPTIKISFDPSVQATTVEGLLFNGVPASRDYSINAYSGDKIIDTASFMNISPNTQSGFTMFSLDSGESFIDQLAISSSLDGAYAGNFDYLIDTIAINEPIENVVSGNPPRVNSVSEPSSFYIILVGLVSLAGLIVHRNQRLNKGLIA